MSTIKVTNIKSANGTSALSIADTSGNVTVGTGKVFAPNGIVFSSTELTADDASTTTRTESSNVLDDYEEGTWTPNYAGSTGSVGSYAPSSNSGWYTKVGNMVTVWWRLVLTNKGSWTGDARITGLPFDVSNPAGTFDGANALGAGNVTFSGYLYTEPRRGNTFLDIVNATSGSGLALLQTTAIANNSVLLGQATYFV